MNQNIATVDQAIDFLKNVVTVDQTIDFLNSLLALDSKAITGLIEGAVLCNDALANHPTVQVRTIEGAGLAVGLLGIINGMFGVDERGYGFITAVFDEKNEKIVKFERTKHQVMEKNNG